MTQKQRIIVAMAGGTPDRVPITLNPSEMAPVLKRGGLVVALLALLTPMAARADIDFDTGGKHYRLVTTRATWAEAKSNAFASVYNGMRGHLATIEGEAENAALFSRLNPVSNADVQAAMPWATYYHSDSGARGVWLGASDDGSSVAGASEGNFHWVGPTTNAAPVPFWQGGQAGTVVGGRYANWGSGPLVTEPDDYAPGQDHVAMQLDGWPYGAPSNQQCPAGKWNDLNGSVPQAYLIEYEKGWYKGELHCHLAGAPDDGAFASVAAAVSAYQAAGYDFLAITGHNIVHDSNAHNVDGSFVTLLGVELHNYGGVWNVDNPGWSHVHSIGCNTPGLVDTSACRTMQDQINLAIALGGIAQINHPLWNGYGGNAGIGVVTRERILATTNAAFLEISDSAWRVEWDAYLSAGRQIYGTITTDYHGSANPAPNTRMVVVEAESLTRAAILAALREGRFYSQLSRPATSPGLITTITRSGRTLTIGHIGDTVTFYGSNFTELASSSASPASYTLPADGLFVRARVSLSNSQWAWTQAYFPPDDRPAGLGRAPATFAPVVPRGGTATLDLSVWNTGGSNLNYTVSDNATWLTVTPASGTCAGETDTLKVSVATAGLAAGTYSGTITVDGGAASNSPQTVAVTLTVTAAPGDLPVVESFEAYPNGLSIAGTNGWMGDAGAGVVTALTYTAAVPPGYPLPAAAHTQVLRFQDDLARAVNGAARQNVNVDVLLRAERREILPDNLSNTVQAAFCVDTGGMLNVWHMHGGGAVWTQRWTALPHAPIGTGQWVRVSVATDYASSPAGDTFFCPRLNGSLCPTAYGFRSPTNLASPGPWYMCANNPARGGGGAPALSTIDLWDGGWIDDLVVSTNAFAHTGPTATNGVPFAWFDRWGLSRDPRADGDHDGVPAEDEHAGGTDPTDPASVFRVVGIAVTNGSVVIRFIGNDSGAAEPYVMERATNGLNGDWTVADPAVPRASAPEPTTTWSEPAVSGGAIFYRPQAGAGY